VRVEGASEGQVTVSDVQGRRKTVDARDLQPLAK
jgi:hypothetical protein